MKAVSCANCREAMQPIALQSAIARIDIDACFACHAFWFDRMESPQLNEQSILDLFKLIHEHRDSMRRTLGARLACPRCAASLVRTQDIQRTNRLEYHRCPEGCGRMTTFFQFLREKNFVRSLSPGEMKQLRVEVSQVRCSSCGATVAVEKDSACKHCGAPVSILDADAVQKTLVELRERPVQRRAAARASLKAEPRPRDEGGFKWLRRHDRPGGVHDMVTEGITDLSDWFSD